MYGKEKRARTRTPKNFHEWKKDQLGIDVVRITETNLMGISNGCHYKTHTQTCVFSMYSYTIHVYVLYGPWLLSKQNLIFNSIKFCMPGYRNSNSKNIIVIILIVSLTSLQENSITTSNGLNLIGRL